MTNQDGEKVFDQDYLPFGGNLPKAGQLEVQNETGESYKFTGQNEVASIGLYYYGARYYDSAIGRFTRQDSYRGKLKKPQTQHLYVYVINNPLRYTDPTGYVFKEFYNKAKNKLDSIFGAEEEINKKLAKSNTSYLRSMPPEMAQSLYKAHVHSIVDKLPLYKRIDWSTAGRAGWQGVSAYGQGQAASVLMAAPEPGTTALGSVWMGHSISKVAQSVDTAGAAISGESTAKEFITGKGVLGTNPARKLYKGIGGIALKPFGREKLGKAIGGHIFNSHEMVIHGYGLYSGIKGLGKNISQYRMNNKGAILKAFRNGTNPEVMQKLTSFSATGPGLISIGKDGALVGKDIWGTPAAGEHVLESGKDVISAYNNTTKQGAEK